MEFPFTETQFATLPYQSTQDLKKLKIAFICILIAGLMPLICTATAKWGFKDFDNHNPRQWLSMQTGFRARANAAQVNCFEAFPFFAASVGCALGAPTDPQVLALTCMLFVTLRALYIIFYVADLAGLRTVVWVGAYACIISNFIQAILMSV